MKNARAAGLQVKGENGRERCNILHCSSFSLSCLSTPTQFLPACATRPAQGQDQIRPDQTG